MSQSEDYLDSLLNSINKAKTDAVAVEENAQAQKEKTIKTRKSISPDDDFFSATGIDEKTRKVAMESPLKRRGFSEDDFLKEFENSLGNGEADDFIAAFEEEIDEEEREFQRTGKAPDAESIVDSLLNNIKNKVNNDDTKVEKINEAVPEQDDSDDIEVNTLDEATEEAIAADEPLPEFELPPLDDDADGADGDDRDDELASADTTSEDDLPSFDLDSASTEVDSDAPASDDLSSLLGEMGMDLDSNLDLDSDKDPLDEFAPDEMDALDSKDFDGENEPDLSGESGLDLDNILGEDDDLMDIQSILDGDDDESLDIDESAEQDDAEDSKGKKKKKEKKPKKEKGEKKPLPPFVQKLLLIVFGEPEEEDPNEKIEADTAKAKKVRKKDPSKLTAEQKDLLANAGEPVTDEEIAEFEKKKAEKKEKPKKEEKPKEEKPKKPPKPKKEKKPKEPDNSPKIPLSIIVVFLVLSISIIGVVLIGMNYMGVARHMNQARELFEVGDYISAYEKLNGLDLTDEDDILLRNKARTLADLQQCKDEYEVFIAEDLNDFALDSLIKGIGRYEKFKDEATEYGIIDQYDEYCNYFVTEIGDKYGLSKDDALYIFNQKNRHYYTIELRKVLIRLGLDE